MDVAEMKRRARATWAAGDYDGIVDYIWSVGGDLVERVGIAEGDLVLDVACGTGNASIPAARRGGRVTGLDGMPLVFNQPSPLRPGMVASNGLLHDGLLALIADVAGPRR